MNNSTTIPAPAENWLYSRFQFQFKISIFSLKVAVLNSFQLNYAKVLIKHLMSYDLRLHILAKTTTS